jgi:ComF family protein
LRGWVFSSSRLTEVIANPGVSAVLKISRGLFSLLFPSDCRVCRLPLTEISRIPVCPSCLNAPEPFSAEYYCASCRAPFVNAFPLDAEGRCALCRHGLRGFDAAYCYGAYEGVLRELIHVFKYGGVRTLARPLGSLLSLALPRERGYDLAVPVPLHWMRRYRRGFNQSELLAREIGRRCGIPVRNALRRVRSTRSQAGLSNTRRRENVSAAFRARGTRSLSGLRILLVDDVMTTGSTAAACAAALKRAGAAHVVLLTVARVDRRFGAPAAQSQSAAGGK